MGTYIGKVAAVFTANTSGLVTGTREASSALTKMQSSVKSIGTSMNSLVAIQGAQLFAGITTQAANAAGSLLRMADDTAEVIDQQSKLSRKIGVSLADFQAMALAADLAGISQEKVAGAVQKMGIQLAAAGNGNRKAIQAFEAIGINFRDLQQLNPADQFTRIATALSRLPTPAEQAGKSVGIFGKSGKDLLDLFADGAKAVKDAAEYAELFGTAISTEAGDGVETMKDNITLIGKAIEGFKTQIVAAFAPAVSEQITAVIDKIKELGGIKTIAQDTAIFLAEGAGKFIDAASIFASKIDTVLSALNTTVTTIGGIGQGALAVGQRAVSGLQGVYAAGADLLVNDGSEQARKNSNARWDAAFSMNEAARANSQAADNWWNGTAQGGANQPPAQTPGEIFAQKTREAVERERQAAAERERARAAATDSTKRDGLGAAKPSDPKAEKTMAEQLAALRQVAANTAKQAVMTVFNIPGAAAR